MGLAWRAIDRARKSEDEMKNAEKQKRIDELERVIEDLLFWIDPDPEVLGNAGCECFMLSRSTPRLSGHCAVCRARTALGLGVKAETE